MLDCLVIGGGPAGLAAATYLGRYRRAALVIDAGASRAAKIPLTHNYAGFKGIAGPDLLARIVIARSLQVLPERARKPGTLICRRRAPGP